MCLRVCGVCVCVCARVCVCLWVGAATSLLCASVCLCLCVPVYVHPGVRANAERYDEPVHPLTQGIKGETVIKRNQGR